MTPTTPSDATVSRPHRPGTVTRGAVLDAAMALLRDGGAEALSMRRLAGDLGVSTQVVYSRVGGKSDVARALHDRAFGALEAQVAHCATTPGTRAHVHEVAQHYFDHAQADPVRFELMFGTPIKEFVRDGEAEAVEIESFRRTWVAAVRGWLDATHPDRQRPTAVRLAYRLWTAVHGITTVHLAGHSAPGDGPEAELHAMVDLVLDAAVS